MNKIFAKKGTAEKIVLMCPDDCVNHALELLNIQLGGTWVYVDYLAPGEFVHFTDESIYQGFHGRRERYCSRIKKLTVFNKTT